MPYVKPTVHLSRIAGTALKSFTHGYAQTVVAASQSSYAAQNTAAVPLADTLIGRIRKHEKNRQNNVYSQLDGTRHASTSAQPTRPEAVHHDTGLEKYLEAWNKNQKNGNKGHTQFQFARRLEWQPPTNAVVPVPVQEVADVEEVHQTQDTLDSSLKRSYTTSALDNFGKAFINDEAAEAVALAQVNDAIAEEIAKSKDDAEDQLAIRARSPSLVSHEEAIEIVESESRSLSPASIFTPAESFSSVQSSESEEYTQQLLSLAERKRYADIPATFQGMLRAGVQKPSQAAYRALLSSAIELTHSPHLKTPRALEVYSDMLRRKVVPDSTTYGMLISLLSIRAQDAAASRTALEERLTRYGGLEKPDSFMFRSTEAEYMMLVEDNSLSIALKMFERARDTADVLPSQACAALIVASAKQGRVEEMNKVYEYMESRSLEPQSAIYAPMINAFGDLRDLRRAVEVYDEYKDLAIKNNAGKNEIMRLDNQVYAALIKAYGTADRLKGGLKFLSSIQAGVIDVKELEQLREVVALEALLPLALQDPTFRNAFDLTSSLTGHAFTSALAIIVTAAADRDLPEVGAQAFDRLAQHTQDLAEPSMAMLAMHVRNANVEAAEPFWRILEAAPVDLTYIEPTTMRAVALIGVGQAERGLRQSRRMFARVREATAESKQTEAAQHIDEAIELISGFMVKNYATPAPQAHLEILRMMLENGNLIASVAEHMMARFGAEQINRLSQPDLEFLTRVQSRMILEETSADIANSARIGCLLDNILARSIMPSAETETMIEKTLINIDRPELSRVWNNFRYPSTPAVFDATPFTPVVPFRAPASFEDTFDPYASRTDVKGSNLINDMLDRTRGRRMDEALTKFRNMRRIGRVPRMFTYGKLIEAAAKEHNLNLARDVLEMAKKDVPFDARYRVVRFGWQQILDHMVAGCLSVGRRDLASKYHQDMIDMGFAPSANTFGLYITTLKENTKTFDEATEAVKIFLRAKAEGVEPTSFLYNALIGKLGKARRIDDCLFYFAEMRSLGIRPTSVTYGTIVNALCRVSDEKFAEEIFEEMESCANYKPRPAPYHSLMQYFLSTKRDRAKVLSYYERMRSKGIQPTVHTYKLLIDTYATLEPINMPAAEAVLSEMSAVGVQAEAVHYASLIHAKGCVLHDMESAQSLFDSVLAEGKVQPQPCMYQAVFESLNANHRSAGCETLVQDMATRRIDFTPYIANALIHGWMLEKNITKAKQAYDRVPISRREPSTYEAMVRAYLAVEDRDAAKLIVHEALSRGYPSAVAGKIAEMVR